MTAPYLIAHKVRGQPAFDVAERITCPECRAEGDAECVECDGQGYWWILSTCGYRAHPYWHLELAELWITEDGTNEGICTILNTVEHQEIPISLLDCFPANASPTTKPPDARDRLKGLGLIPKLEPMRRI